MFRCFFLLVVIKFKIAMFHFNKTFSEMQKKTACLGVGQAVWVIHRQNEI